MTELEDNLRKSILIACERLNMEIVNIDNTVADILSEFKHLKTNDFTTALRNGGLGKYGRTYKLNTQELCFWIREYNKKKNSLTL